MSKWSEVADAVFQQRFSPLDVSVCVAICGDGLAVVDTRSNGGEADELLAELRLLSPLPVRWVINTHGHYDHCFGNQRFAADVPIYGHERMAAQLVKFEAPMLADWIAEQVEPVAEWRSVVLTAPTECVSDALTLDLGGRRIELAHLGRGHTDNDLVVHVPDAGAWLVGDLVEESGPPAYGRDSFPFDWPVTTAALLAGLGSGDVVVPGHGAPVDAVFVANQLAGLVEVAQSLREVYAAGVPATAAYAAGTWPYAAETLTEAITVGYRHLSHP